MAFCKLCNSKGSRGLQPRLSVAQQKTDSEEVSQRKRKRERESKPSGRESGREREREREGERERERWRGILRALRLDEFGCKLLSCDSDKAPG